MFDRSVNETPNDANEEVHDNNDSMLINIAVQQDTSNFKFIIYNLTIMYVYYFFTLKVNFKEK